ncbi:MAG: hypothetical protein FWD57_05260 [Polyangiaceae bacterium]|nr:hypothetical protein [Polyangiaceae bacterium]
MIESSRTPDAKYRDFVEGSRVALKRARRLNQAKTSVTQAASDMGAQLLIEYGSLVAVDVKKGSRGEIELCLIEAADPHRSFLIADVRYSDSGFPMFVSWPGGSMHCSRPADVYECIWSALARTQVGEFLMEVLPDMGVPLPDDDDDAGWAGESDY